MAKRPVEKYDFKVLGQAIKDARKERKESRKKVSDEMFISPRYLANIENKGQHPSLNTFYQIVTLLDISVDQFFYPDNQNGESDCRKHIDVLLNSMDERELTVMEATAEGLQKAHERPEA